MTIASTRAVYERKLADVLTKPEKEEEPEQNGDSPEEEMKNGYSDSDIDGMYRIIRLLCNAMGLYLLNDRYASIRLS